MTALELADIIDTCKLPPGVFNVITGLGPDTGAPLSRHPGVDKIAFTGSFRTGSAIMNECAKEVRKVTLELGGKSPIVVFDVKNFFFFKLKFFISFHSGC